MVDLGVLLQGFGTVLSGYNLVALVLGSFFGIIIEAIPSLTATMGDCPFPNGYQAVRNFIRHVHVKDARRCPDGSLEYVSQGDINWPDQIRALMEDGYSGYLSVETHIAPKVAEAQSSVQRLRKWIAQAEGFSQKERYE